MEQYRLFYEGDENIHHGNGISFTHNSEYPICIYFAREFWN